MRPPLSHHLPERRVAAAAAQPVRVDPPRLLHLAQPRLHHAPRPPRPPVPRLLRDGPPEELSRRLVLLQARPREAGAYGATLPRPAPSDQRAAPRKAGAEKEGRGAGRAGEAALKRLERVVPAALPQPHRPERVPRPRAVVCTPATEPRLETSLAPRHLASPRPTGRPTAAPPAQRAPPRAARSPPAARTGPSRAAAQSSEIGPGRRSCAPARTRPAGKRRGRCCAPRRCRLAARQRRRARCAAARAPARGPRRARRGPPPRRAPPPPPRAAPTEVDPQTFGLWDAASRTPPPPPPLTQPTNAGAPHPCRTAERYAARAASSRPARWRRAPRHWKRCPAAGRGDSGAASERGDPPAAPDPPAASGGAAVRGPSPCSSRPSPCSSCRRAAPSPSRARARSTPPCHARASSDAHPL